MTIAEVLRAVDTLKPNRFERARKVEWLAQLEGQIFHEIVCTHENPMGIREPVIDNNTDPDYRLIAPFPYDEVYSLWLQCQIDLGNMEIGKYNNDKTLYNNALMTLRDYWNRTFMPCERVHAMKFDERLDPRYHGEPLMSAGNPLDMRGHEKHPVRPKTPERKRTRNDPARRGKWNVTDDDTYGSNRYTCSCCGYYQYDSGKFKFCPECGAKME